MKREEEFRLVAGAIFSQLEDAFPEETKIDEKKAADLCGVAVKRQNIDPLYRECFDAFAGSEYTYGELPSGRQFLSILWSTLKWLRDEGMIRAEGTYATESIILTSEARNALAKPSSDGTPLAEKMSEAARDVAAGENRSKLTTTVGELLGSFVKGAFLS